jgi:phage tail sheath protein FI
MPQTLNYPGVYIEEIPSGVHTIIGVATSITAFVGRAPRGEVNEPITINSYGDYERLYGGLSLQSTMSYAVSDFFANGGAQAVIVRVANGGVASSIIIPENLSPPPSPPTNPGAGPYDGLYLQAASVGSWGNLLSVQIDLPQTSAGMGDPTIFSLTARLWDTGKTRVILMERYLNVSVDPNNARYIARVLEQSSNLVVVAQNSSQQDEVPPLAPAPGTYWGGQGVDDNDVTENDFIGVGFDTAKLGLYALEKVDLFNILVIPPYPVSSMGNQLNVDDGLRAAASTYCETRRAFYVIDSPSSWESKEDALNGLDAYTGSRSKNSALFFPRLLEPNMLHDNQIEEIVASGAVAGIFAKTDAQRGVWKAPAGQETALSGNIQGFTVPLTDAENGELNPLGVNCLRTFHIIGNVVWGSRTLQGADELTSEWKYIPVRRMALFLEESLFRGTKWVVFEPNDEALWTQIRMNVNSFMQGLFQQGAFAGTKASDAYLVKCDQENNPPDSVDQGIVNILVAFAPLEPAEFVVIQIQQLAGQSQA